ncbi:hypothetical protein [Rhodopirellula sallentina]|uniref:Membrane protein n=1 Tax=Rhodopirellula sallentina SM41 TaxID=1263870 RepID=M5U0T9_9BACT|nr:hypothetical protein [Rhodopirellula sallentina]EMI54879.1 membrane protein [Rhodopirellula sallentina SM41]
MTAISSSDAVGRTRYCSECRKQLKFSAVSGEGSREGKKYVTCTHCGHVNRVNTSLPTKLRSSPTESADHDPTQIGSVNPDSTSGTGEDESREMSFDDANSTPDGTMSDSHWGAALDGDIKLKPPVEPTRYQAHETITEAVSADSLATASPLDGIRIDPPEQSSVADDSFRQEQTRDRYNQSSGLYPSERHYPTLEAMQRLYRLFGYVIIATVFPYLFFRLFAVIIRAEEGLLPDLIAFSEFAVPVIFASVALVGTLFAASEGIRLAINLQDNTLRIANRNGRLKK